jgi:hypothetical protein
MRKPILKWELIGIAVISSVGALLHFAFEWSGQLPPIGVFAAVNESVFEHLKLTYWPALLYTVTEYRLIRESANNFLVAKAASIYLMPAVIVALFYAYTTATGIESLVADIMIFIGAIALGQLTSYKILTRPKLRNRCNIAALAGIVSLGVVYAVFTFYPPRLPIFLDPVSGTYGIP